MKIKSAKVVFGMHDIQAATTGIVNISRLCSRTLMNGDLRNTKIQQ